jgi:hypothetical protein
VACFKYDDIKTAMLDKPAPDYLRFPCVTPGWDNSPRRRHGAYALIGSTPSSYRDWVARASLKAPVIGDSQESLVFVNAWNEWAEGAHLEPDQEWGHAFLEAHRDGRRAAGAVSRGRGSDTGTSP